MPETEPTTLVEDHHAVRQITLHRPATGAGWSLALAGDLRIAAESASFIQAFINVGAVSEAGSTSMLPRLVGMARAAGLARAPLTVGLCRRFPPRRRDGRRP